MNKFIKIKKYFGLIEYYLIKLIGWFFLLIGINNFKDFFEFFIDRKTRENAPQRIIDILPNYELTFVFIPIIIGGILLLRKKPSISDRNE